MRSPYPSNIRQVAPHLDDILSDTPQTLAELTRKLVARGVSASAARLGLMSAARQGMMAEHFRINYRYRRQPVYTRRHGVA